MRSIAYTLDRVLRSRRRSCATVAADDQTVAAVIFAGGVVNCNWPVPERPIGYRRIIREIEAIGNS